jgi:chromosome segregation ATPase
MRCLTGNALAFMLALLLLCILPGQAQSASSSEEKMWISRQEIVNLRDRALKLQIRYHNLRLKVKNLESSSKGLTFLLEDLRVELQTSQNRITGLNSDILGLKTQLVDSLKKSQDLEASLTALESNYKALSSTFLQYQKEAEKQIRAEKAKAMTAIILAWIFGGVSAIFGTMYGIERFILK